MRPRSVVMVAAASLALVAGVAATPAQAVGEAPGHAVSSQALARKAPGIRTGDAFVDGIGGGEFDRLTFTPGRMSSATVLRGETSSDSTHWYGYDFTPSGSKLYGVVDDGFVVSLARFDQRTGSFAEDVGTVSKPDSSYVLTDLTIDPVSGRAYVAAAGGTPTSTVLYRIDLSSASTTLLAEFSGYSILDLSMDCSGRMYGVDRLSDALVRVDPATGGISSIGPLGVDIQNAQGIDFDNQTGVLHAWLFDGTSTHYSRINLRTGSATAFPGGQVAGEYEGAIKNVCPSTRCPTFTKQLKHANKAVHKATGALKKAQKTGKKAKVAQAKKALKKAKKKQRQAKRKVAKGNCP